MTLQEFLIRYSNLKEYHSWKKRFQDMYEFTKEIQVIPWQEEFNIKDENESTIDELEFLNFMVQNKMISEEEIQKTISNMPNYSSKTLIISFVNDKIISFREKRPDFYIVLNEIGNTYFNEYDIEWNYNNISGEILMWLIINDKFNGDENTIKQWHKIIRLLNENSEAILNFLDKIAFKVANLHNINLNDENIYLSFEHQRPILQLMSLNGMSTSNNPEFILENILKGINEKDLISYILLEEILKKQEEEL